MGDTKMNNKLVLSIALLLTIVSVACAGQLTYYTPHLIFNEDNDTISMGNDVIGITAFKDNSKILYYNNYALDKKEAREKIHLEKKIDGNWTELEFSSFSIDLNEDEHTITKHYSNFLSEYFDITYYLKDSTSPAKLTFNLWGLNGDYRIIWKIHESNKFQKIKDGNKLIFTELNESDKYELQIDYEDMIQTVGEQKIDIKIKNKEDGKADDIKFIIGSFSMQFWETLEIDPQITSVATANQEVQSIWKDINGTYWIALIGDPDGATADGGNLIRTSNFLNSSSWTVSTKFLDGAGDQNAIIKTPTGLFFIWHDNYATECKNSTNNGSTWSGEYNCSPSDTSAFINTPNLASPEWIFDNNNITMIFGKNVGDVLRVTKHNSTSGLWTQSANLDTTTKMPNLYFDSVNNYSYWVVTASAGTNNTYVRYSTNAFSSNTLVTITQTFVPNYAEFLEYNNNLYLFTVDTTNKKIVYYICNSTERPSGCSLAEWGSPTYINSSYQTGATTFGGGLKTIPNEAMFVMPYRTSKIPEYFLFTNDTWFKLNDMDFTTNSTNALQYLKVYWESSSDKLLMAYSDQVGAYYQAFTYDYTLPDVAVKITDSINGSDTTTNQSLNLYCGSEFIKNKNTSTGSIAIYPNDYYLSSNTTSCYQESANTTNQTGIDGDCGLVYDGAYIFTGTFGNVSAIIDGNWGTSSSVAGNNYIYINYTIPAHTINATWIMKKNSINNSFTMNQSCIKGSNLQIRLNLTVPTKDVDCYNSSNWINVGVLPANAIFEEGINWTIMLPCSNNITTIQLLPNDYQQENLTINRNYNLNGYTLEADAVGWNISLNKQGCSSTKIDGWDLFANNGTNNYTFINQTSPTTYTTSKIDLTGTINFTFSSLQDDTSTYYDGVEKSCIQVTDCYGLYTMFDMTDYPKNDTWNTVIETKSLDGGSKTLRLRVFWGDNTTATEYTNATASTSYINLTFALNLSKPVKAIHIYSTNANLSIKGKWFNYSKEYINKTISTTRPLNSLTQISESMTSYYFFYAIDERQWQPSFRRTLNFPYNIYSFVLTANNGTNSTTLQTIDTLTIKNLTTDFPSGTNTLTFLKNEFGNYITTKTLTCDGTGFSAPMQKAGLQVQTYDETTLAGMTFNITIANTTSSTSYNNQVNEVFWNYTQIPTGDIRITLSASGYEGRSYYRYLSSTDFINLTGYLLSNSLGLIRSFQVVDSEYSILSGANVFIYKFINNDWVIVAEKQTDDSGTASFLMNPSEYYQVLATYQNKSSNIQTIQPTESSYTIIITGADSNMTGYTSIFRGVGYKISSASTFIPETNDSAFSFTVHPDYDDMDSFNMTLTDENGTILYVGNSTATAGGVILTTLDITNKTMITGIFTMARDGESHTFTKQWRVENMVYTNSSLVNVLFNFSSIDNAELSDGAKGLIVLILTTAIMGTLFFTVGGFASAVIGASLITIATFFGWFDFRGAILMWSIIIGIVLIQRGI